MLKGFEVMNLKKLKADSTMTIDSKRLRFTYSTAEELNFPSHSRMLINAATKQVALQICDENEDGAFSMAASSDKKGPTNVNIVALRSAIFRLMKWSEDSVMSIDGIYQPEDKAIIYDLESAVSVKRNPRKNGKNTEQKSADETEVAATPATPCNNEAATVSSEENGQ